MNQLGCSGGPTTQPDPNRTPPISAMPEPCPAQLQPIIIQTPNPNSNHPQSHPSSQHPSLQASTLPSQSRPNQESKSPGSSGRGLWGRREAGAANAEGSELSPRRRQQKTRLQTLPRPHTHRKSHRLECFNTRTPDPQQRHIAVHTDIHDGMGSP